MTVSNQQYDLMYCPLEMLSAFFISNRDVMYLSDIKSCVARTSIGAQFLSIGAQFLSVGAQFLSVGAQFLSVGAQLLTIGAQDAPASCYELCVK